MAVNKPYTQTQADSDAEEYGTPQAGLQRLRGDVVTIPDPSRLTTAQLLREVEGLEKFFTQRFIAYDKAIELLQRKSDKEPQITTVESTVNHLKELTAEQIANIKTLIEKTGELNNTALQAAFAAAKEAVGAAQIASATANTKMETNFTKQLDATGLLISTMEKALSGKIEDIKGQVTTLIPRIEVMAALSSMSERTTIIEKVLANYQGALLVVGLLSAAIPTIVTVLLHFMH
jgi:hypothetical protein